jgi:peptide/nickel transport system ATP-binding protein
MALLDVQQLSVTLRTHRGHLRALNEIGLRVEPGQRVGLIGESGCGKSLTALAIMGLLPDGAEVSGSISLNGQELVGANETLLCQWRGSAMGMVFQEPMTALNPVHTIGQQVAEPLRLHRGLDRTAARAEALRLLERVQLPQAARRLDAYPHQLSGGQRQRVVIAMALACKPKLLIADEPTTALDVTTQQDVLNLIDELVSADGMGLLLISHNLGVMADRVAQLHVMYAGRVVEAGPTAQVLRSPVHPYTRGLLASRPQLGMPRGTRLPTIAGRVPGLAEQGPGCSFAPRCALAEEHCRHAVPELVGKPSQRAVRCWLAGALSAEPSHPELHTS